MKQSRSIRKTIAVLLALLVSILNVDVTVFFAAEEDTIFVTPFQGQWKYFGQSRRLLEGEHYILSDDIGQTGWLLTLESENVGKQKYVLQGNTENIKLEESEEPVTFEIRKYSADKDAKAKAVDQEERSPISVINKKFADEYEGITIQAPEGYLINLECQNDATTFGRVENSEEGKDSEWAEEIEYPMEDIQIAEEKPIEIKYYLRSDKADLTRNAIDEDARILSVRKDTKIPVISALDIDSEVEEDVSATASLTSDEAGTYYYIVAPEGTYSLDDEGLSEMIQNSVKANMGIVGSGRMNGNQPVTLDIQKLSPQTEYQILAVVVDKAGNESQVEMRTFRTNKMALEGSVTIVGNVAVNSILTAHPDFKSVDVDIEKNVSYQWYRIQLSEDDEQFNQIYDMTDESDDDLEDDDSDESEDGLEDENEPETQILKATGEELSLDDAEEIEGATLATYKVTKEDIGYRLMVSVQEDTYSGKLLGMTTTFVPKLIPFYQVPVVSKISYLPTKKLSSIKLPANWYWINNSIIPEYGNDGYRAKFVPTDSEVYQTVVVQIKVPVTKREIKKGWVQIAKNASYTGKAIKNNFKIKDNKYKLVLGKDYQVTYSRNKELGKATVKIKGIGNYKGTVKVNYQIVKKSIKNLDCKYTKTKAYTGKQRKISVQLLNDTVTLKKERDYTVTYKKNTEIGKATLIIKGMGNYKGTRKLNFTIVPSKPKMTVKKKGKGIQITLSSKEEVDGYLLLVSSSSTFKKNQTQQYFVTGNKFEISNLPKGTYYIRTQTKVSKKGTTYKSEYRLKKIKIDS